jgi:hypothetical protein
MLVNTGASNNHIGTPALADRNVAGRATTAIMHHGVGVRATSSKQPAVRNADGYQLDRRRLQHRYRPRPRSQNGLIGGTGANQLNVIGRTLLNGIEYSHGWNPDGPTGATDSTWCVCNNQSIGNWSASARTGVRRQLPLGINNPGTADNGNGINAYDGSSHNLIQANYVASAYDGIQTMSANATDNTIKNNLIGVSPLGQAPVGRYGINVREHTTGHTVVGNQISNTASTHLADQPDVRFVR